MPPQQPDYEVVIPFEEEEGKVIDNGVEFHVLQRPTPPMAKLEEKDLFCLAHFLHDKYEKGFTWGQLPLIIGEVVAFIGPNPEMILKEKRKAAIDVLHYLMVSIDPLYLPEKATDPFFEELIAPYIELALTFPQERDLIQPSRTEPLTEETLTHYSHQIKVHFEEGMTWQNLALATHYALTYILSYENLSHEDQVDGAYAIIDSLLSETDPSRLPPYFDERLYKIFLEPFIALELKPVSTPDTSQ